MDGNSSALLFFFAPLVFTGTVVGVIYVIMRILRVVRERRMAEIAAMEQMVQKSLKRRTYKGK